MTSKNSKSRTQPHRAIALLVTLALLFVGHTEAENEGSATAECDPTDRLPSYARCLVQNGLDPDLPCEGDVCDLVGPEIGDIIECATGAGNEEPFVVVDSTQGSNYEIWVLEEVLYGPDDTLEVRIGWNMQVTHTKKRVDIWYDVVASGSGSDQNWASFNHHGGASASMGTCGVRFDTGVGDPLSQSNPDSATGTLTGAFGGVDTTWDHSESTGTERSTWSSQSHTREGSTTVEVGLWDVGSETTYSESRTVSSGDSTTVSFVEGSSVTIYATSHLHGPQDYSLASSSNND